MSIRTYGIAALAASLFVSSAFAQDIEPNQTKAEATANGTIAISAGGTITGTSTGTVVTTGSTLITTVDTYRIRTGALALGIYEHRLTLTSAVAGHTGSIRGLNQTGTAGVGGTAGTTDTQAQASITTTTPPRYNQWYGFGKQEELYYRVAGTATTTAAYTATMSTTTVTPNVIAQAFDSNCPVTFTTVGQSTLDTEILLYDAALNLVGQNDNGAGAGSQSKLTRLLAPGTYYLAVTTYELCVSAVSPPDENFFGGVLVDFPDCVLLSQGLLTVQDYDFQVQATNGTWSQTNQATGAFLVPWYQVTLTAGAAPFGPPPTPPANDACAAATALTSPATVSGTFNGATNDGTGSLDATGKDVWYSFTNTLGVPSNLSLNTCATVASDTVLHVYNGVCGALTEIAASDTCGGSPCGGPGACLVVALANGQAVRIRVSDKALSSCDFSLSISNVAPPPPNDDCSNPTTIAGLGTIPVSNFAATTGSQGQAEPLCINVGGTPIRQDVWYTWVASNSGVIQLTTCAGLVSGSQDTKIAVYLGTGCPTNGSAIACNDDDPGACGGFASKLTFNAVCGSAYTFQFGMYQGTTLTYTGSLFISTAGPTCDTPTTASCLGDGTGAACPCGNNSTTLGSGCATTGSPGGATLTSTGVASDETSGTDTLVLTGTGLTGPALFIQSSGTIAPFNFGDGHLCAAIGIIRLGIAFPAGGVGTYPNGVLPKIHVQGLDVSGNVRTYQAWYRSTPALCNPGVQNFDLTQALTLTWGP